MGASFGHGFRLLPGIEAERFFERFRAAARPLACRLTAARIAHFAQATADDRFLGRDRNTLPSPIELALAQMGSRYERCQATKRREPEDDVQCEASYVQHEGRTYVLLHAEMMDYHDLLAATEGIEHWPWYDADNPPADVSCAEWSRRREVWHEIMKAHAWSMPGVFQLLDDLPAVSTDDILAALPTLERRARRVALPNLVSRRCQPEPTDMSGAIEAVIETSGWINGTEEGKAALREETASVASQLARSTVDLGSVAGENAMEACDAQHGC